MLLSIVFKHHKRNALKKKEKSQNYEHERGFNPFQEGKKLGNTQE